MQTDTHPFDNLSTKLIACAVIVACLLLGLAGLILPLIPGLLFIAIAAFVAVEALAAFRGRCCARTTRCAAISIRRIASPACLWRRRFKSSACCS